MRAKNIANTVLGLNRNPLSGDKFASKSRNVKRERKLIPISEIDMHEDQPRSHSDQLKLERLMHSIKEEGLHHPIHVFWDKDRNKYRVVSGHRRLLAHIRLRYEEIEAEILPDKSSAKIAAVSINELSEQIHPIDKGVEVASLLNEKRFESISDIATYYGWSERTAYLYYSYVIIPEPV
ncbi:MAG: hypothetical protein CO099_01205 [Bdellovibrio sp. CG_4_9_14_3_um_filter_39_7]|nr:MAG: hypothetical protein CO099_01205 [Bdellovibrio sp. CG_4_9_14_3_um_filter_39_7]